MEQAITGVAPTLPFTPSLDPENLTPGARIGSDYEIREKLGAGGMATVYAARHLVSGAARALKVARPDLAAEEALRAEHLALQASITRTSSAPSTSPGLCRSGARWCWSG